MSAGELALKLSREGLTKEETKEAIEKGLLRVRK